MSQINLQNGQMESPQRPTRIVTPTQMPGQQGVGYSAADLSATSTQFFSRGAATAALLMQALQNTGEAVRAYGAYEGEVQRGIGARLARVDFEEVKNRVNNDKVKIGFDDTEVPKITDQLIEERTADLSGPAKKAYRDYMEANVDEVLYNKIQANTNEARKQVLDLAIDSNSIATEKDQIFQSVKSLQENGYKPEQIQTMLLGVMNTAAITGDQKRFDWVNEILGEQAPQERAQLSLKLQETKNRAVRDQVNEFDNWNAAIENTRNDPNFTGPPVSIESHRKMLSEYANAHPEIPRTDVAQWFNRLDIEDRSRVSMEQSAESKQAAIQDRELANVVATSMMDPATKDNPAAIQRKIIDDARSKGYPDWMIYKHVNDFNSMILHQESEIKKNRIENTKKALADETVGAILKSIDSGDNMFQHFAASKLPIKAMVDGTEVSVSKDDMIYTAVMTRMGEINQKYPAVLPDGRQNPENFKRKLDFFAKAPNLRNPEWEAELSGVLWRVPPGTTEEDAKKDPAARQASKAIDMFESIYNVNPIIALSQVNQDERTMYLAMLTLKENGDSNIAAISKLSSVIATHPNDPGFLYKLDQKDIESITKAAKNAKNAPEIVDKLINNARVFMTYNKVPSKAATSFAIKNFSAHYTDFGGTWVPNNGRLITNIDKDSVSDIIINTVKANDPAAVGQDLRMGVGRNSTEFTVVYGDGNQSWDHNVALSDEDLAMIDSYNKAWDAAVSAADTQTKSGLHNQLMKDSLYADNEQSKANPVKYAESVLPAILINQFMWMTTPYPKVVKPERPDIQAPPHLEQFFKTIERNHGHYGQSPVNFVGNDFVGQDLYTPARRAGRNILE